MSVTYFTCISLYFLIYVFKSFTMLLVSPGESKDPGRADQASRGSRKFQDSLPTVPFSLLVIIGALMSRHVVRAPGRSKPRPEACSAFLSLKPEQDYFHLISLKARTKNSLGRGIHS